MASTLSDFELSSSVDQEEEPFAELTDEELYNLLQETLRGNEVIRIETEMFESYFKRIDPKDVALQGTITAPPQTQESNARSFRRKSRSRGHSSDRLLKLTSEQKCDIATRELDELRDEIETLKDDSEKVLDNYRAVMEEADIRLGEIRKSQYEFNRDVVVGAVNKRTKKTIAEKVVRYLEDKLRSRDTLIEKLRLKNATLKVQKKKLQLQLKQKEEMGEVLHEVDFNQLKIENSQYLEKIDERNQDLLKLKLMAGNVTQVLNSYKKKLNLINEESARLKSEISLRKDLYGRVLNETDVVEQEREKAASTNKAYKQELSDFRVPEVLSYVKEKSNLDELRKSVHSWERKVEIADMSMKTHSKAWRKIKLTAEKEKQSPWNTEYAT